MNPATSPNSEKLVSAVAILLKIVAGLVALALILLTGRWIIDSMFRSGDNWGNAQERLEQTRSALQKVYATSQQVDLPVILAAQKELGKEVVLVQQPISYGRDEIEFDSDYRDIENTVWVLTDSQRPQWAMLVAADSTGSSGDVGLCQLVVFGESGFTPRKPSRAQGYELSREMGDACVSQLHGLYHQLIARADEFLRQRFATVVLPSERDLQRAVAEFNRRLQSGLRVEADRHLPQEFSRLRKVRWHLSASPSDELSGSLNFERLRLSDNTSWRVCENGRWCQ